MAGNKLVFVDRTGMDLLVHDNEAKGFPQLGVLKVSKISPIFLVSVKQLY